VVVKIHHDVQAHVKVKVVPLGTGQPDASAAPETPAQ